MQQLSITETRKNLTSLVHRLSTSESEPVGIEVRGKKAAVLLSNKEYERMKRQILDQEIDIRNILKPISANNAISSL